MKKKYNFIVINFFRVTNPYSGASEISYNFFKNIPSKNKKLIQLSNIKQKENKVETLIASSKLKKILRIFEMAKLTEMYCKNKKYPVIIIEGASWVGYTFLFYFILKKKLKNAKFIYHSHNIEYLLRKQKNNYFISILTKYFENYIGKKFDIFTSVSNVDKKKIKEIYDIKSELLPNGINTPNISRIKKIKLKFNYIFFCGSIEYMPNKEALDILINKIMPLVIKKNPKIKLVVSGNKKIPYKQRNLINVGFVSKIKFYSYLKGASLFVNPMKTAFGSQVKMISALVFGKTIIASKKATLGLDTKNKFNKIFVANDHKEFARLIIKNIYSKKTNQINSRFYRNKYSFENITKNFIKNI